MKYPMVVGQCGNVYLIQISEKEGCYLDFGKNQAKMHPRAPFLSLASRLPFEEFKGDGSEILKTFENLI